MFRNLRRRPILIAAGAALTLAACTTSSPPDRHDQPATGVPRTTSTTMTMAKPPTADASTPHRHPASITIKNYAYTVPRDVKAGATVTVRNDDTETHTVTSDTPGQFDVTIAAGSTAKLTVPRRAGTYKFHCNFHSNMHGVLTVGS